MKKTLYTVLGVAPDATEQQIRESYARLQAGHESGAYDRNAQIMAKEAFAVLSNPAKRSMYDMSLAAPARPVPVETDEPGSSFDWRHGLAIALAAGIFSGWWFSRPDDKPAIEPRIVTRDSVAVPARAPQAQSAPTADPGPAAEVSVSLSSEDLFAKLAPGIVRVNVGEQEGGQMAIGSGVVIAARTVITNCHVVQSGGRVQVKSGNTSYDARLSVADRAHDLCQLDVPKLEAAPVSISPSGGLRTGQKVVAIGAPHGLDLTISEGIVSSLRNVSDGRLIQTTAPVSPGSSGGGLFDMQGNLVGIVTFQVTSGQNLNFAAPTEWIDSISATSGNGIIGKLAGRNGDADDEKAEMVQMLARRWACRDAIDGFTFQMDINDRGRVEMRKDNKVMPAYWRFVGKKIEVVPQSGTVMAVEYLMPEKLIFDLGKGVRVVCALP